MGAAIREISPFRVFVSDVSAGGIAELDAELVADGADAFKVGEGDEFVFGAELPGAHETPAMLVPVVDSTF